MKLPTNASESFRRRNPSLFSVKPSISHAEQCERPKELARSDAGKAPGASCPLVCFTLHRVQLLDVDAKYGSVKDLLDGLQYAGLIAGDKEGQIDLKVEQIKVKHREEEQTVIEITYEQS
jgi:hypothetical protein